METIFELKESIANVKSNICYEKVKSYFIIIRPSYFKDDCYPIDNVLSITPMDLQNICKILSVVTSECDPKDFYEELRISVFGTEIKPFYYLDCNIKKGLYSLPQLFIINKVIEVCYSKLISYNLFRKFSEFCEIKPLDDDANVAAKATWIKKIYALFLKEAGLLVSIDSESSIFSDNDVSGADFLKDGFKELASVDNKLEKQFIPVNNPLFWDNMIFAKASEIRSTFDYYKYIDTFGSSHTIKDIINLFDPTNLMKLLEEVKLEDKKKKEQLWEAMIYDAIYYSYITLSLYNCNDEQKTSFKRMCNHFYEQYVLPAISEKTELSFIFDIYFSHIQTDNCNSLSVKSYRKIKRDYIRFCEINSNSIANAFNSKIEFDTGNKHFKSFPELYEAMLIGVIMYNNIQENKPVNIKAFKDIYYKLFGLNVLKQKDDDTTFKYEIGWYFLNIIFNYSIKAKCKTDAYDWTTHPTKMVFTSQVLKGSSPEIIERMHEQDVFDYIVYIISLIILKMQYCNYEQYYEILESIKTIIHTKQATELYDTNTQITDEELTLLQRKEMTKKALNCNPEFKEKLNLQGKTVDRIRMLLQSPNASFNKEEIMYYCDREKSSVEKALYQLIEFDEIRYIVHPNSKARYYEMKVSKFDRIMSIFKKKDK